MTYKEAAESLRFEVYEEGHCGYIEEELTLAIIALEKQIPKKMIKTRYYGVVINHCPVCKKGISKENIIYCEHCGQRIDNTEV